MKLPRDVSGRDLARAFHRLGYRIDHQTGSHIRLVRDSATGTQGLTIPAHSTLKVGTLNSILKLAGEQLSIARDELLQRLFG